jgi:hypothetical protein
MQTPHNTIEHTHANTLARALEHQVPRGDTNGEVADH